MRRFLVAALVFLLSIGAAEAKPLTAKDVRMLLALSGLNPGTTRLLNDKGRHQLDYVKVTGHAGRFIVRIREHEVSAITFGSLGAMSMMAATMSPAPTSEFFQLTFGQLLEIASIVGGMLLMSYHLGGKMRSLEGDVVDLKSAMVRVDKAITDLAVTNNRLDMFDIRMDDIVKGRIRISRYAEPEEPRRGRR